MKRYQKELRTNTAQVEQITTLSVSLLIFNIIWFPKLSNNMETVLHNYNDYNKLLNLLLKMSIKFFTILRTSR